MTLGMIGILHFVRAILFNRMTQEIVNIYTITFPSFPFL